MNEERTTYAFDDEESARVRNVANWWAACLRHHGEPAPRNAFNALLEAGEQLMLMSAQYQAQRERNELEREGKHAH